MKKLAITLLVSVVVCSCKKSNPTPIEQKVSSPTNTSTDYNGFLTAETITTWGGGAPVSNRYFSSAEMSQTASAGAIASPSYNGTITLNSTVLKAETIGTYVYYLDTTNTLNLASQHSYQFTSTTSLPSFSFSNTDAFPIYPSANGYLVNDTLFKTQTLTLSLANTSGYDEAACVIYEVNNASNSIAKVVPFGTTQVVLSPSDLVSFAPGATVLCGLSLKKYNTQTFSGKNFRFETSTYNNFYMLVQ